MVSLQHPFDCFSFKQPCLCLRLAHAMLLLHGRDMFLTQLLLKHSMRCVQEGYAASQGKQVQS